MDSRIPVTALTGFLGSGKTTLLQRLLRSPQLARTAVLINEIGEIGLDHLLIERAEESVVLLKSGCICCSIRDDLKAALRGLLGRRERAEIPDFDRVVIETTGLADPGPILYTLSREPVVRHHFRLANVITTVDAVNASLHLAHNPEGVKQVAAADRLVITKTDLVDAARAAAVREALAQLNPSAEVLDAAFGDIDAEGLLASSADQTRWLLPLQEDGDQGAGRERDGGLHDAAAHPGYLRELRGHSSGVMSLSLALEQPLDWTAFGLWLSMLLHRHGNDVLRVKGMLHVQGMPAPVLINAVQHIVHPPQHLQRWPSADRRSRIVFITRGIDHVLLRRSLAVFAATPVSEDSYA